MSTDPADRGTTRTCNRCGAQPGDQHAAGCAAEADRGTPDQTRWAFLDTETGDWIEVKPGVVLLTDSPEAAERLAAALPAVARSLWARSEVGDHQQVWFDEDVLRHFEEYADDTAAAILAALREEGR